MARSAFAVMAPAEKTGKFSRQKKKHKSRREETKTGGWKTEKKDEDRRRKALHYGRFKFTATKRYAGFVPWLKIKS